MYCDMQGMRDNYATWCVPMHRVVGHPSTHPSSSHLTSCLIESLNKRSRQSVNHLRLTYLFMHFIGYCNTFAQRKLQQQTLERMTGNCDNYSVRHVFSHCARYAKDCVSAFRYEKVCGGDRV